MKAHLLDFVGVCDGNLAFYLVIAARIVGWM
jgi:hypothetical protein